MIHLKNRLTAALGGLPSVYWVLWSAMLVNRMAGFVGVFLALYLRQQHGFNEAQAGWVVGLWGFGATITAPIWGTLADLIGRRSVMLAALVLGGLAVVAIAYAESAPLLVVLSFFGGALQQGFYPASNAIIADVVAPVDRPRAYGHFYWAMNMGLSIGFVAAGLVPSKHLLWLFLADAATTFLSAALVAWKVPETRPVTHHHEPAFSGLGRVIRDRVFVVFATLHMLALVVFTQFQLSLPLDMAEHGVGSQGFAWVMGFNCIGVVLLQPWLSPLLQRVDPSRLLAVSAVLIGVGYWVNAFVSTLPLYLFGAAFWTVGEVVGFPAASTLVADLAPVEVRGRYQGAFSMVWGLAMGLSPILGGQVMHHFGAPTMWWGCLVLGLGVSVGHWLAAAARRERTAMAMAAQAEGERALASS